MRQILFVIPLSGISPALPDVPIYGYGLMLFFAYLFCTALGKRLCKKQGLDGSIIPDLAIWLFVAGILGGRLVFVVQYWNDPRIGFANRPLLDALKLWDGGLVLYGALIGGAIGYFAYDYFVLRKYAVSRWKMLDVVAPCLALGVALGRIGCLCTGCCYGNIACEGTPAIHFPADSMASSKMIQYGYQSPYGFLLKEGSFEIDAVESGSPAADADLRRGDSIVKVNGAPVVNFDKGLLADGTLALTVLRDGAPVTVSFSPTSCGVNPTQIYETISMCLLLFALLSYFPYRRHDGELMVFFMLGYGVHRFLNEMLRTDTDPVAFGLTLSQNISIVVLATAAVLAYFVWRRPKISDEPPSSALIENVSPPAITADAPRSDTSTGIVAQEPKSH
jgi:phosphatidylglycerol---prolipoprotein diacylglyceryl transferase